MLIDMDKKDIRKLFGPFDKHNAWTLLMLDERFNEKVERSASTLDNYREALDNPDEEKQEIAEKQFEAATRHLDTVEEGLIDEIIESDEFPDRAMEIHRRILASMPEPVGIGEKFASRPEEITVEGFSVTYEHVDGTHYSSIKFPAQEGVLEAPVGPIEVTLSRNPDIPNLEVEKPGRQFYRNYVKRTQRKENVRSSDSDFIDFRQKPGFAVAVPPFKPDMEKWGQVPEELDKIARRDEDALNALEPTNETWIEPTGTQNGKWMDEKRKERVKEKIGGYREQAAEYGRELAEKTEGNLGAGEFAVQTTNMAYKLMEDIEEDFSDLYQRRSDQPQLPMLLELEALNIIRAETARQMDNEYTLDHLVESSVYDKFIGSAEFNEDKVKSAKASLQSEKEKMKKDIQDNPEEFEEFLNTVETYVFNDAWLRYNSRDHSGNYGDNAVAEELGIGDFAEVTYDVDILR